MWRNQLHIIYVCTGRIGEHASASEEAQQEEETSYNLLIWFSNRFPISMTHFVPLCLIFLPIPSPVQMFLIRDAHWLMATFMSDNREAHKHTETLLGPVISSFRQIIISQQISPSQEGTRNSNNGKWGRAFSQPALIGRCRGWGQPYWCTTGLSHDRGGRKWGFTEVMPSLAERASKRVLTNCSPWCFMTFDLHSGAGRWTWGQLMMKSSTKNTFNTTAVKGCKAKFLKDFVFGLHWAVKQFRQSHPTVSFLPSFLNLFDLLSANLPWILTKTPPIFCPCLQQAKAVFPKLECIFF